MSEHFKLSPGDLLVPAGHGIIILVLHIESGTVETLVCRTKSNAAGEAGTFRRDWSVIQLAEWCSKIEITILTRGEQPRP